ncbi:MAG TPA: PQQ-binding-like beta-propeller repeat protein, partial [Thermoanaerobaculia bacterium]
PHDWPQFNFDARHSGSNTLETEISPDTVTSLQLLFQTKLPAVSDSAPAYWADGSMRRQEHSLFFTAADGTLIAISGSGRLRWQTNPPPGPRWTTSAPVLDPSRRFIYSYALDGCVHKFEIRTGEEIRDHPWPVLVTRKPDVEKGSSALSIATDSRGVSYLYATVAGYPEPGDEGDYQGHVVAIRLDDGSATVFNVLCSDRRRLLGNGDCGSRQAGVWGRPGVVYNPSDDSVYVVTSNGSFTANVGGTDWGDTILRLPPDLYARRGQPVDSYTPDEFDALDKLDLDLGSSGVALLPRPGETATTLAAHAGKDGIIRLIDLRNMSGRGVPGLAGGEVQRLPLPQGGGNLSAPAVWNDDQNHTWVYFTNDNGVGALELVAGNTPQLVARWHGGEASNSSPVVANGVLFCAKNGRISALNARTGEELWSDTRIGNIHWQSPIVADGAVYMSDLTGTVTAWALPNKGAFSK